MEFTETMQEQIIEVQDAEVKDEEPNLSQPFAIIEDIPVFFQVVKMYPKKICKFLKKKINKHIIKNFKIS